MNKHISIKDSIIYSVNAVLAHPWFFVKIFLLWLALSLGLKVLAGILGLSLLPLIGLNQSLPIASQAYLGTGLFFLAPAIILTLFFFYFVAMILWLVPAKLLLHFYDDGAQNTYFNEVLSLFNIPLLFRLVTAVSLYGLLIFVGTLLLAIPGIIAWIRFQFVFYNLINRKCGIIEAFALSFTQTKDNFWRLFALNLIAITLSSLIITIPIAYMMLVYAYRQLPNSSKI